MELFQAIALLCQIGASNSTAATVQQLQRQCQQELVTCVSSIQTYDTDRTKLIQCLSRR